MKKNLLLVVVALFAIAATFSSCVIERDGYGYGHHHHGPGPGPRPHW